MPEVKQKYRKPKMICPFCQERKADGNFRAFSINGMTMHVRQIHPEHDNEYQAHRTEYMERFACDVDGVLTIPESKSAPMPPPEHNELYHNDDHRSAAKACRGRFQWPWIDKSEIVGWSPQTGQPGSFLTFILRKVELRPSQISNEPDRLSPTPISSFRISEACMEPIIPQSAPNTPACAQDGTCPSGGGSLKMQR